jgi:hypothetical protein
MLVTRPYLNQERLLDPNTLLLLHFDGSNNSTSFVDSSANPLTPTVFGGAKLSSDFEKFGGTSGDFRTAGSYIEYTNPEKLNLGTGNFTIEFWILIPSTATNGGFNLFGNSPSWQSGARAVEGSVGSTNSLLFVWNAFGANAYLQAGLGTARDTWIHVAFVRDEVIGTQFIKSYVDGVLFNAVNPTTTDTSLLEFNFDLYNLFQIGRNWNMAGGRVMLDEFRISNVVRYTANFTPSNAPFNP